MLILNKQDGLNRVFSRTETLSDSIRERVEKIISDIRINKDEALFAYTEKFDGFSATANNVMISKEQIKKAYDEVPEKLIIALRNAKKNIENYHKKQLQNGELTESSSGAKTGYMIRPVERAGIYVPGGKASYPSSVLMAAVPAYVAGVKEIIMCTPGATPLTLVAAAECGVSKIFKVGGAQAIAAMAYGTETIPKADVICGPGNMYVAEAKKQIFGVAGIDMIAGPSEILIIADDSANPVYIASDLLSQAEHDEMAMSILVTTSENLAKQVSEEVEKQLLALPKERIARASIDDYGTIILANDLNDCVSISNEVAPEHLELCVENPEDLLPMISNAGAVFMGHWSPEPLGDYYAGTNHVLPNGGTARFFSALGVNNFTKRISLIKYDKKALLSSAEDVIALAEAEGLDAHANSIKVRIKTK
ncbi:MAG: histidinol dehydrogenase [Clostridia bacterium]|nr:histidinol dehydrogenase [Clostridia bacterium]